MSARRPLRLPVPADIAPATPLGALLERALADHLRRPAAPLARPVVEIDGPRRGYDARVEGGASC